MKKVLKLLLFLFLGLITGGLFLIGYGIFKLFRTTRFKNFSGFFNHEDALTTVISLVVGIVIMVTIATSSNQPSQPAIKNSPKVEAVKTEKSKETSKPKPQPKKVVKVITPQQHVKNVIHAVYGKKNDKGKDTAMEVDYFADNHKIVAHVYESTLWNTDSTQKRLEVDRLKSLFKGIFHNGKIDDAMVMVYVPGTDKYGNSTEVFMVSAELKRDLAKKINFDGIAEQNFDDLAIKNWNSGFAYVSY